MEAYPESRVVQLDSVVGKRNDEKAILTIYFKNSKLQFRAICTLCPNRFGK
ncbi:MAG: hypothetical protein IJI66_14340 [Erysipelotrichaceae bacterium]|nr:hypothetical protein [Erysipelotrichaceae bacterium]